MHFCSMQKNICNLHKWKFKKCKNLTLIFCRVDKKGSGSQNLECSLRNDFAQLWKKKHLLCTASKGSPYEVWSLSAFCPLRQLLGNTPLNHYGRNWQILFNNYDAFFSSSLRRMVHKSRLKVVFMSPCNFIQSTLWWNPDIFGCFIFIG